ncbi:MAG: PAS domain S-box protein [Bacillota bacterium]|nr:PAS domain S-box protein [Bacillota bacterium]
MILEQEDPDVADDHYKDSFNLLFDHIEDCLIIFDEAGRIIRVNKAVLEKMDYTQEEMLTMNIALVYSSTTYAETQEILKGILEGNISQWLMPLCTKSGKRIPLETRMFKGKWEGNDVLYTIGKEVTNYNNEDARIIGAPNDTTERTQLELELGYQNRFLKTILDAIPDFIFYKDVNSVLIGCNKAYAQRVLGINEDEVRGKTDFDLIKDIEQAKLCQMKDRETFENVTTLKYETKFVLTDGSVINTEIMKTPFWDEQGKVAGLIGIARDISKRKKLEKQLRAQVEYAELLFRTVPSAVLSVDKNRKIFRWNKIAEEITGYTAAEVIGKECSMVLHGVGVEGCALCLSAIDSPLINQMCKIVAKDGQIHHALKSIAVLKDEYGEISERMECFEDITGIMDMEAELRESEERYAAIVNNAPQIVIIVKEGIIQFVNDAGIEVLGYKDYCIGRQMKEIMTESSLACVNSALIEGINGEHCVTCEAELIKKSGEIINVLLKGTDITLEHEKAFLAVMMDITESKQLNVKLRASEEKFRQLAETINEIFLINDKEKIVYVSPAYERISGMTCQSLIDNKSSFAELIHPVDFERIRTFFFEGFQNMFEAANEEFRIIRPDGEMRWLWVQSYPIRDEANKGSLKATSIVDITDRKKIEEQLRAQERQTNLELFLAARVQQDSLPHPFVGDKVSVCTIFKPYRTVSGDFFNYKWFEGENKLCGYIIDVCGHGMATALQTATFKMMLDNVLLTGDTIEEGDIHTINQKIMNYLYEGSFLALLYFEFDLQQCVLKLISAGITLFLAAKPHECSLVPISGCYLGIIDDPIIETTTIQLKVGEIYCLMTDGASDLIELHGISKQESLPEYMNWLEKLAGTTENNDDFTVIGVEVLQENMKTNVLEIKNVEDLETARVIISEYLERNASIHAPVLEVAINEAINNGFNACGRVRVKTRRVEDKLIVRVKDYGPGFKTEKVNALLKKGLYEEEFDELLEAEGGRGILMMKMFCDRVIYNSKGNEVLMMKRC